MEVEDFTDDEKNNNFLNILATIRYIEDGGRITEDWMEEHKRLIRRYRDWVPDYSRVNSEVEQIEFRRWCSETETLMCHMCHDIQASNVFNVKVYLMFLKRVKQIVESLFESDIPIEDVEVANILNSLSKLNM